MQKIRRLITALLSPTVVGIMLAAVATFAGVMFGLTNPALGTKAKAACYAIAAIALVSIALYVWNEVQKAKDRERLSEYLSQATRLLDECIARGYNSTAPPAAEVDLWIRDASEYLGTSWQGGTLEVSRCASQFEYAICWREGTAPTILGRYVRIYARVEVLKKLIDEQAAR